MSDVYRIGVAIMVTQNGLASALSAMSHQLLGVHASVARINSGIGAWRTGLIGAASIMGGSMMLGGLGKILKHGDNLLDQQDKLIRAGRTHLEVANLTAEVFSKITRAVPTATAADVLRVANELTMVKGDFAKAAQAASGALKLEAVIGNATGKSAEGQGYNLWRAVEEKGVSQDEALTDKVLGSLTATVIASAGKIGGGDVFTFAKRAGSAWIHANDDFLAHYMPTLIQSLGADTAGTALMTARQMLTGATTLSKQQFEALGTLHLIDPSKVSHDKGGRVNVAPGGIVGAIENDGNVMSWAAAREATGGAGPSAPSPWWAWN